MKCLHVAQILDENVNYFLLHFCALPAVSVSVSAVFLIPHWRPALAMAPTTTANPIFIPVRASIGKFIVSSAISSTVIGGISTSTTGSAATLTHIRRDVGITVCTACTSTTPGWWSKVVYPIPTIFTITRTISVTITVAVPVADMVWSIAATDPRIVHRRRRPRWETVWLLVTGPRRPAAVVTAASATTRSTVLWMAATTRSAEAVISKVVTILTKASFRMAATYCSTLGSWGKRCFPVIKFPSIQLVRLLKHRDIAWLCR